eukprot:TRINITY_DN59910_c0_g1_i1.p1 TRINITY_DN59910_c0_g1~~TRINITY_DN59910_c0_g1_i1.p1  ORF type:complete len:852 (-),score=33.47 TRINITY_DN59910_c0_g1_i1:682-2964(-)
MSELPKLPPPRGKGTLSRGIVSANDAVQMKLDSLTAFERSLQEVTNNNNSIDSVAPPPHVLSRIQEILDAIASMRGVDGSLTAGASPPTHGGFNVHVPHPPRLDLNMTDLVPTEPNSPVAPQSAHTLKGTPRRAPTHHAMAVMKDELIQLNEEEKEQLQMQEQEKEILAYISKDLYNHGREFDYDLLRQWEFYGPKVIHGRAPSPGTVAQRRERQEVAAKRRIRDMLSQRKATLQKVHARDVVIENRMCGIQNFDELQRRKYAWQTVLAAVRAYHMWEHAIRRIRAMANNRKLCQLFTLVRVCINTLKEKRKDRRVDRYHRLFIGMGFVCVGLRRQVRILMIRRIKWFLVWAHNDPLRAAHIFYLRVRAAQRAVRKHVQHRRAAKGIVLLQYEKVEQEFLQDHIDQIATPMQLLQLIQEYKLKLRKGEIAVRPPPVINTYGKMQANARLLTPTQLPGISNSRSRLKSKSGVPATDKQQDGEHPVPRRVRLLSNATMEHKTPLSPATSDGGHSSQASQDSFERNILPSLSLRQMKNRLTTSKSFHELQSKVHNPKPELRFLPIPVNPLPPKEETKPKRNRSRRMGSQRHLLTQNYHSPLSPSTAPMVESQDYEGSEVSSSLDTDEEEEESASTISSAPSLTTEEQLMIEYTTPHSTRLQLVVQHLLWRLRRHQKALQQWRIQEAQCTFNQTVKYPNSDIVKMPTPVEVTPPPKPYLQVVLPYPEILRLVLRGLELSVVTKIGQHHLLLHHEKPWKSKGKRV